MKATINIEQKLSNYFDIDLYITRCDILEIYIVLYIITSSVFKIYRTH